MKPLNRLLARSGLAWVLALATIGQIATPLAAYADRRDGADARSALRPGLIGWEQGRQQAAHDRRPCGSRTPSFS